MSHKAPSLRLWPLLRTGGAKAPSALQWQGPSPLPQCCAGIRTGRGPKAPGQRPPRPRRAPLARRVGRWPLSFPDLPVYRAPSRAGGGNAMRFLFPPGEVKALSPRQWQGHRPCHSAAPGSGPAGGLKPPASARPATGGRLSPAGSGAGLCVSRTDRSTGDRPERAGETRCVSFSRPHLRQHPHRFTGRGHRPCHSAALILVRPEGPKPPANARPATGGRWPLCLPDLPVTGALPHAPGGNPCPRIGRSVPSARRPDGCLSAL